MIFMRVSYVAISDFVVSHSMYRWQRMSLCMALLLIDILINKLNSRIPLICDATSSDIW